MVRAQRFAIAATFGVIHGGVVAVHECDNPLCVAVGVGHLVEGTQSHSLADMGRKRRGGCSGCSGWARGSTGLDREARRARAVALRDAMIDGWDDVRVREALVVGMPGQPTLFELDDPDWRAR